MTDATSSFPGFEASFVVSKIGSSAASQFLGLGMRCGTLLFRFDVL